MRKICASAYKPKWVDNVLVARDKSLFTVYADGTLEIRGKGWDRRKKGDPPGADRPRVCHLLDEKHARKIAELVASRCT